MMRRIIGWFVLIPLCAILAIFALANRHMVPVRFDPLSPENPIIAGADVPLFIVIYGMLILGIAIGGIAVWFTQGRYRRERRQLAKQTKKLDGELVAARKAVRQQAVGTGLLGPDDLLDDV